MRDRNMDEEQAIIGRVLAGNKNAYAMLVRRYEPTLRRYLLRQCGSAPTSDDLAQEAFLAAYVNLKFLRNHEQFRPWLFRIAHNLWIDHCRQVNRRSKIEVDHRPHVAAPEGHLLDIERALDGVSEIEKTVLILSHGCGMTQAEVSVMLELPLGTVKSHSKRGLEKAARAIRNVE